MSKPTFVVIHQTSNGTVDSAQTFNNFFDAQRAFDRIRFNAQLIKETRVRSTVVSSEVILRK
jgi:hypothetical protein